MSIKAEVAVRVLNGGGYLTEMTSFGKHDSAGQPTVADRKIRARENMMDVIEDVKDFLARKSNLSILS